jgi:CubicO group peptidase (beta-lactamase class C family)
MTSTFMHSELPRTISLIERGMQSPILHIGAQLYVSLQGKVIADLAVGQSRPGVAMRTDTIMPWMSCTKPVVALAAGLLWERGLFDLDDAVARYVPEFGVNGKEGVTIRHLLTHTGGFRAMPGIATDATWKQIIAAICEMKPEAGWVFGEKAGYHTRSSWFILGEIIRRLDGREVDCFVREEIFEPLDMSDSWIALPVDRYEAYGERIGWLMNTAKCEPTFDPSRDSAEAASRVVPGAGGRGPMRELARFYEMLLARGKANHQRIVSPQTVEAMTARHRAGMYDHTFKFVCDWGLGFKLDSKLHGKDFEPYGYGIHASHRTFGHGGAESSVSFADPKHQLAVAICLNGTPGDRAHQNRMHAILTALYEDLSL